MKFWHVHRAVFCIAPNDVSFPPFGFRDFTHNNIFLKIHKHKFLVFFTSMFVMLMLTATTKAEKTTTTTTDMALKKRMFCSFIRFLVA